MGGWNRGKGKTITFLRAHLDYEGDECVIWPFFRDHCGYGTFGIEGKMYKAHRWVCEQRNGPPPTPEHEAAHSCGRGHDGCITPRHLSWKTRAENAVDAIHHGTTKKAPGRSPRKLTHTQVQEILALKGLKTCVELSKIYGVRVRQISRIHAGTSWRGGLPRTPGQGTVAHHLIEELPS